MSVPSKKTDAPRSPASDLSTSFSLNLSIEGLHHRQQRGPSDISTNYSTTDGQVESSQNSGGADVVHRMDAIGTLSTRMQRWLQSNSAQAEPQERTATLEDLLALLDTIELSKMQQGATLDETADARRLKLSVIRQIAALLWGRFKRSGRREDLDVTIDFQTRGLQLARGNGSESSEWLGKLGLSYDSRFEQLGCLEDLGRAVEFMEQAVVHIPFDHPGRPRGLNDLGCSYLNRFRHLGRMDDLGKSVGCHEQAVILTPDGHPDKPACLSNLGVSYQRLFERLGRLDDLEKSVDCNEQAVMLTPNGHPAKPGFLNNLGISLQHLFQCLGRLDDMYKSVGCQEQAVMLTPEGDPDRTERLDSLGITYRHLFERLGRLDDLDKSVGCKEQAVILTPDGHPAKPERLSNLSTSYLRLFQRLGRLDDLDKSVDCLEQVVKLTLDVHPDKPARLNNLGNSYQLRFQCLGRLDDLDRSLGCLEQAVMLTPDGHPDKPARLNSFGTLYQRIFEHLGRLDNLYKSMRCFQQAVMLAPDGQPGKSVWLGNLGISFAIVFRHLGRLEHANYAADCLNWSNQLTPDDHPEKFTQLNSLGNLHKDLFTRLHLPGNLLYAMNFHKAAALIPTAPPSWRLQSSRCWAQLSYRLQHPSLEAYTHCMTLIPLVVWLGTSVHQRYKYLADEIGSMVTEAAAVAISSQQYGLASEWLEQGRSIVWGQTLELRTPYDTLHAIHPELAKELQDVSYQLECLSAPQPVEIVSAHAKAPSHDISWKHRRLAQRREELLSSARLLPGFEDFLRPLKASKLVKLVQAGTAVMVTVHNSRCDALVIQGCTREISHVPLAGFSVHKAQNARTNIECCFRRQGSRRGVKKGHIQRESTFKGVLAMLWNDVVKPVLDHIGITQVLPADDLPHITWCTTGPLSFLPLHAAGDYSHPSTVLSNLAISSYAPTLSSLAERTVSPGLFSGILAIGHASSIRGLTELPGTKAELDQIQMQAGSLPFIRLDEENARTDTVLKAMEDCSWVHFACHASQNSLDPLKSALHLHDGDLDLATIACTPLKNRQLAFLSACQTATGDSSLPDESIHLAAGLLMAGYSTVIATMWSINDQDAPLVAGKVYECLLEGGSPDSRKAALALHKAVASLRERVGVEGFARWVPYVHIGR